MTTPAENPNQYTEPMLDGVHEILTAIQENYGLTRGEAIGCLTAMAGSLETRLPGDPDLVQAFHQSVENHADGFEEWAFKVGVNVIGWKDHA